MKERKDCEQKGSTTKCVESEKDVVVVTQDDDALLERDEPGRVSGTDTRTTVLDWFVRHRELRQVVANHVGLFLKRKRTD